MEEDDCAFIKAETEDNGEVGDAVDDRRLLGWLSTRESGGRHWGACERKSCTSVIGDISAVMRKRWGSGGDRLCWARVVVLLSLSAGENVVTEKLLA